ncbi:MAG: hypothetical protein JW918_15230 [Anaerolineae bacterium]|nr:hypothetical protein [Anaerolineae bacterium]
MKEEKAPPFNMQPVEPPSFPDRVFDVRDWGALDDGKTANTDPCRGLPEHPARDVVLERLRFYAVQGVRCQDVDGLTLNDVGGSVEKKPPISYENVQRLNETEVNLRHASSRKRT